ncbi:NUDIX hydrolase domain-like protein [Plectosphaerella cucumerina]|uniref:NUDIX hydrolase domain-like protein n=1 Tax=Plectosphaerella cucumerina TaxID=40658 RepID=A0A8K0X370_9PEZI|nr:NUDIX hydrolase domain-like protein [Plectosphaerella cucumerina]
MTSTGLSLHFADQFVISCGTVTLDVRNAKVLLVRQRTSGEVFLPKGRKDIGERLEDTATRETFEETGVSVDLLPCNIPTRATAPSTMPAARLESVTEPIAVTQRISSRVLKIILWYIAAGDSTAVPQQGTQQEGEDFDTVWVDLEQVTSTVTFDDDKDIITRAINTI